MMTWLFIGLVITILLTPGPTNTLLASAGIHGGFRKSVQLVPAEAIGYFLSISIWGIIIESVSSTAPWLPAILKLISASYIFYLAIKLWRTSRVAADLSQPAITAKALFAATLLNPKGLLFASAIFPHETWSSLTAYTLHMSVFLSLIVPIACFWISIGSLLVSNRVSWLNQCNLQRTASIVLMSFSLPLSYSAISSI
ncbi:LysE family transporter [Acinetobacter sp. B5B]|uniref:LysE family translocator n=1 Tax=Acinetobacter baretiae TaxID=2605383 RepID=UPI0018C251AC|nr:LysE family transporter [Acinetobacter baretiae]MBF7682883.1 LysE family transporter [Acinetobacter baretiae]MBF7684849.1 LysE family transporter [Acinetobacter baretiae]